MKKKIIWLIIIVIMLYLDSIYAVVNNEFKIYDSEVSSSEYKYIDEIIDNTSINQSFLCDKNGLNNISIRFATFDRTNDITLNYTIACVDNNTIIAQGEITNNEITNNAFYTISFDKQVDSDGKVYQISFEAPGVSAGNGISIYKTDSDDSYNKGLTINQTDSDQALVLSYNTNGFDMETLIMVIFYEILIVIFAKILMVFLK